MTAALANQRTPKTKTSIGGVNVSGFMIVSKSNVTGVSVAPAKKSKAPRTLAEANAWLLKNAKKVDAHAKASTKRLIGRDSV